MEATHVWLWLLSDASRAALETLCGPPGDPPVAAHREPLGWRSKPHQAGMIYMKSAWLQAQHTRGQRIKSVWGNYRRWLGMAVTCPRIQMLRKKGIKQRKSTENFGPTGSDAKTIIRMNYHSMKLLRVLTHPADTQPHKLGEAFRLHSTFNVVYEFHRPKR